MYSMLDRAVVVAVIFRHTTYVTSMNMTILKLSNINNT
jgi:hypothetical protein